MATTASTGRRANTRTAGIFYDFIERGQAAHVILPPDTRYTITPAGLAMLEAYDRDAGRARRHAERSRRRVIERARQRGAL